MIECKVEECSYEFVDKMFDMFEQHRIELSKYKDMVLNPDMDTYMGMQRQNQLLVITANDGDEVVGYAVFFLLKNPHYSDFLYAHQDIFYVTPHRRASRIAIRLNKFCEEELAKRNIDVIVHHAKLTNNFGRFMESQGYNCIEKIYAKRISDERV